MRGVDELRRRGYGCGCGRGRGCAIACAGVGVGCAALSLSPCCAPAWVTSTEYARQRSAVSPLHNSKPREQSIATSQWLSLLSSSSHPDAEHYRSPAS